MHIKRFFSLMAIVCIPITMTGCAAAIVGASWAGSWLGAAKVSEWVKGSLVDHKTVEENLPGLDGSDNPQKGLYKCMDGPSSGDIFIVMKSSDDQMEDRKKVREMTRNVKSSLPSIVRVKREMPLSTAPIFPKRGSMGSYTSPRTRFTGTWLVVSR